MADPFSVATGALQVAAVGVKLATLLNAYVESVRTAEKQHVGKLLQSDEIRPLYTPDLLASTNSALLGCNECFGGLEAKLSGLFRSSDQRRLSFAAKLTMHFKQSELQLLQTRLERYKSSLDLILGVLNLASYAKSMKHSDKVVESRIDLQRLLRTERAAKKAESLLLSNMEDGSEHLEAQSTMTVMTAQIKSGVGQPAATPLNVLGAVAAYRDQPHQQSTGSDSIMFHLVKCELAASNLAVELKKAIKAWTQQSEYRPKVLVPAFESVQKCMTDLPGYLDVYDEMEDIDGTDLPGTSQAKQSLPLHQDAMEEQVDGGQDPTGTNSTAGEQSLAYRTESRLQQRGPLIMDSTLSTSYHLDGLHSDQTSPPRKYDVDPNKEIYNCTIGSLDFETTEVEMPRGLPDCVLWLLGSPLPAQHRLSKTTSSTADDYLTELLGLRPEGTLGAETSVGELLEQWLTIPVQQSISRMIERVSNS